MLTLKKGEAQIWQASLIASSSKINELRHLLSDDEIKRAERFVFERDRHRFIIARGQLRTLLGEYLAWEPADIQFEYGSHGKPALAVAMGIKLEFNVSHSQDWALYAFHREHPVGVDLEYRDYEVEVEAIADRFFSRNEAQQLKALFDPELQRQAFFNAWARKEALLKAMGEGLAFPLKNCEVSLIPGQPAKIIKVEGEAYQSIPWTIKALALPASGFTAAIVVAGTCEDFHLLKYK